MHWHCLFNCGIELEASLKKKQLLLGAIAASACIYMNVAHAWDLAFAVGRTGQSQTTLRLGAAQNWESRWFDSSTGYLSGYWDTGLTYWESGKYDKDVYSFSISPVFTYNFKSSGNFHPFIEAGVGVSAFSKTKVGDKRLGSSFNFEDRLGFGFDSGRHRFGVRVIHYSNAGIKNPNEGIESYSLYYNFRY